MRFIRQAMLLALLVLTPVTARAQDEVSFATPEEGIAYFVTALQNGDAEAALAAFAIDERVEQHDFVPMGEQLRAVSLRDNPPPVRHGFYRELARIQFLADAASQLRMHVYSLVAPDAVLDQPIMVAKDDPAAFLSELEAALDPARLSGLKLVSSELSLPDIQRSDRHKANIERRLTFLGGDDIEEHTAHYELDGVKATGGFTFIRYGERWKLLSLNATLANLPANGAVER